MATKTAQKPSATPKPPVSGPLAAVEEKFYEWFVAKAPFQLPKEFKDFLVKYGPWITLVIGILSLPAILAILGVGAVVGTVATAYGVARIDLFYWLSFVALIVQVAVMFYSVPKLLKQERFGWQLIFYANIISFLYGIFNAFTYGIGSGIGSAIFSVAPFVIGQYILFQIREYYTK
jgi:hypothetical protein